MDPLSTAQSVYRSHLDQVSTNLSVLGATFVTPEKELHFQKLERTLSWGSSFAPLCPIHCTPLNLNKRYCLLYCKSGWKMLSAFWDFASKSYMEENFGRASALEGQLQVKCPHGSFNSSWSFLDEWTISCTKKMSSLVFTHILRRLPSLVQTATRGQASSHSQGCNQNWKITTKNSYHRISHMLH